MAKDGTNRGGRRVRAGDKPTPLADKITAGKAAKVLEAPDLKPETALTGTLLPSPAVLTGTDMPEPSEYLRANQKDGKPLGADALFIETWRWLKERACDQFISPRLVESPRIVIHSACFLGTVRTMQACGSKKCPYPILNQSL